MSKDIVRNKDYILTRFWGVKGVMYQVTQDTGYVTLTKRQIKHILKKIEEEEK